MSNDVSDLTIEVLKDIREEMRGMRAELHEVRGELHGLNERVETGFASVNQRLDSVLKIVDHGELESRVKRIEDHLGFPPEH